MSKRAIVGQLAEIQGLYGPFSFTEKLLQKIWLRGDFDRAAALMLDGRRVQVLHPGKWNLLGGPDFRSARLRFSDGPVITGEVELHLDAADWAGHGHARDRAYDGVVLHVVLFPPEPGHVTVGAEGREIPVLVLLPLLLHDLEEFAAEEAVETLANRPAAQIVDVLGLLGAGELARLLREHALRRWQQKVHFARLRIARLGWTSACHHAALEILGYRFNRAPMLRIAAAHPLAEWQRGVASLDEWHESESGAWSVQGVRPANRPRTRLRQYAAWVAARADWPGLLIEVGKVLPLAGMAAATGGARKAHGIIGWRDKISAEICAGAIAGTRLDNLVCDGFLPLLTAQGGVDLGGLWFHWYPGDLPPMLAQALRALGMMGTRGQPASHGLNQGLLGWLLEREKKEATSGGRGA